MIEARANTILRGVEPIGGGLYPEELRKLKQRVKKPKKVCKGIGCITRISAYNRDYRGHLETLCYDCQRKATQTSFAPARSASESSAESSAEATEPERCDRGHDLSIPGAYSGGRCTKCKKQKKRLPRASHQIGYKDLRGLETIKNRWGGTFSELADITGYKQNTIKSWAYLTCGASEEAIERLARALGCTEADLLVEAGEES